MQVRGKMYLSDGRKMKSHPALFSTLALEISHLDDKVSVVDGMGWGLGSSSLAVEM